MTTATTLNDGTPAKSGPTQAYAVGLNVGTLRGLRIVSHGGSWAGYRGHFIRFPEQRFAVATFCNLTTSGPDSLARKVAGIYLADRMVVMSPSPGRIKQVVDIDLPRPRNILDLRFNPGGVFVLALAVYVIVRARLPRARAPVWLVFGVLGALWAYNILLNPTFN